ncbi:right-handed parallel beta-helix repeat-containing protein [Halosimplex halophilum]|uniref:right-handed parallel beta-helix repeat-containing protein n=1 Tax=Halosimplex halophilum TaxID=2559572 RepID=UPI00107F8644|nr:right-handed parallel beta-helix repeat-containing protein [Halosimplex halophilum]
MAHDTGDGPADRRQVRSTRRTFLAGIGAAAGVGATSTGAAASLPEAQPADGRLFYVRRGAGRGGNGDSGKYTVLDGRRGNVAFTTGGSADEAFQFALDQLAETGGTVVAAPARFQFAGPVTVHGGTHLAGQGGARFVASDTGARDDPVPTDDQSNPLPTGHDLVRLRGDDVAVTGVVFDADGTQLDNQAVQADGCDGVYVANNRTVNGFQMALSVTRCRDVTVVGNEVVDPNWYGITNRSAPPGGERDLRRSEDVRIVRNAVGGVKFNNIAPYNVEHFAVSGNLVFDGGHSLIACSPSQRGAIVGNVCRDLTEFAPDPGGEAGIEIEYKETHVNDEVAGTPAARSYDITIAGNQVDGCPVGVLARTVPADSGDTAARRQQRPYGFSVTGNTVSDASDAGIRVRSGESGVVATNTLRNNDTAIDVDRGFTADIQQGLNATR